MRARNPPVDRRPAADPAPMRDHGHDVPACSAPDPAGGARDDGVRLVEGLTRATGGPRGSSGSTGESRLRQISGSDAARMAVAVRAREEMQVDVCDINNGVPVNQGPEGVRRSGPHARPRKAREIIAPAARRSRRPADVKFRLGLTDETVELPRLGRICEGKGPPVALHARTARADNRARRLEPHRPPEGGRLGSGRRQRRREHP